MGRGSVACDPPTWQEPGSCQRHVRWRPEPPCGGREMSKAAMESLPGFLGWFDADPLPQRIVAVGLSSELYACEGYLPSIRICFRDMGLDREVERRRATGGALNPIPFPEALRCLRDGYDF